MVKRKWALVFFCVVMVLSAMISARRREQSGAFPSHTMDVPEHGFSPRQHLPVTGSNPARDFGTAIADAVEKVMPSVVVVRTEAVQYKIQRDFFGFTYRFPEQLMGEGSGVIIDERGYVITSRHVILGARQIEVVLNNGTKLPAQLMGFDKTTDLAVLKIKARPGMDYPAVEFGDSDAVRVGEVAIAIGSPFSLQSSVTVGHVSQKGRRVQILPYEDFIQTDAAINEGNSGGPLIDVDGRLIGINAAIKTDAQEKGVGIAFAVPSNLAAVIARSLIDKGVHEWPWVGASFGATDPEVQEKWRESLIDVGAGVPVAQVWAGTSAAHAGIVPGDMVMSVAGMPVRNEYDIYRIIFNHAVGDALEFVIQREKKQFKAELLLQKFPGQP